MQFYTASIGWELSYIEKMGDETFNLGTMDTLLTFE